MFDWSWQLKDLNPEKDVKVFSTFSCGGGSSMGYKRAGFQVIGNVEIDKKINEMYKANHHPKYNRDCGIQLEGLHNDIRFCIILFHMKYTSLYQRDLATLKAAPWTPPSPTPIRVKKP